VLKAIEKLQRYMERDPSVGLSFSFVDILPVVNSAVHETEAKWEVLPTKESQVSLLLAAYFSGNSYQDTNRFIDAKLRAAPIWFYCADHKSENIRRIIKRAQEFIDAHPLKPVRFLLAGGRIGILAAANDALLRNDIMVNVLGFATIFLVLVVTYRSLVAGVYMLIPLLIANAVVNAYMGARDIGININTLPVVTVGVGFGIDYGLYIVSRMVEEYRTGVTLNEAVRVAVATSGKSVSFTAITMIMGTLFWTFSHIRFNAEMGLLLALWMGISFLTTMTLLPVMVAVLKPRFILRERAA
jgi:predicted RND superfamily exporter protein